MLIEPDKLPALTTSYRPITLLITIMKIFEGVIDKPLQNSLKILVFLANISQVLGRSNQQMNIFAGHRLLWKASTEMNL